MEARNTWLLPHCVRSVLLRVCITYSRLRFFALTCFLSARCAADGDAFMPLEFQKTIIGNGRYDPSAPKPYFWPTFFYVRRG